MLYISTTTRPKKYKGMDQSMSNPFFGNSNIKSNLKIGRFEFENLWLGALIEKNAAMKINVDINSHN